MQIRSKEHLLNICTNAIPIRLQFVAIEMRPASRLTIHDFTPSFLSLPRRPRRVRQSRPRPTGSAEPVLRLGVTRYDLAPPQWPADFQLKIAVIADLHACDPWMSLEHIEAIVERTNALNADIIVMLGDYVAGPSPRHPHHSGRRMGAGAGRTEGAARRSCHPRQSRLVGRPDRAARRAGPDQCAPRARSRRHSGLRKRRGAPHQGRPSVLARRARRSTRLCPGAPLPLRAPHRRRRSRRDAWRK